MHSGSLEPSPNATSDAFEDGRIKQQGPARTATISQKTMPRSRIMERANFLISGGTDAVRKASASSVSEVEKDSVAQASLIPRDIPSAAIETGTGSSV